MLTNVTNVTLKLLIIKKVNQFISFNFGDIQLLDIMNFLGGATSLHSFLKVYKTSETKRFVPYGWFHHPYKIQNTELSPYDVFYSKLRSCNPLETEHTDYVNLLKSGLTEDQAAIKLELSKPPPTGIENSYYLQQIWKQEQMSSFKDLLRWYENKDVVPNLEAMQKIIGFYHDKDIDMLKLGCTLPNLANNCLHKSTDAKFYPITEGYKDLWKNFDKTSLEVHLSFLLAKHLSMKLLSESLLTYANLLRLMPANYSRNRYVNPCPPVLIRVRISIQKPVGSHSHKTRPVVSKIWSCLTFNVQDLIVKMRASTLQSERKKLTASVLTGFVLFAVLCLKQWVAFTTFVPVKNSAHLSLKKIPNVSVEKEIPMN